MTTLMAGGDRPLGTEIDEDNIDAEALLSALYWAARDPCDLLGVRWGDLWLVDSLELTEPRWSMNKRRLANSAKAAQS